MRPREGERDFGKNVLVLPVVYPPPRPSSRLHASALGWM